MKVFLRMTCVLVMATSFVQAQEKQRTASDVWIELRLQLEKPQSEKTAEWRQQATSFIISLTTDEILGAARAACEEATTSPRLKTVSEQELGAYTIASMLLGRYSSTIIVHVDKDKIGSLKAFAGKLVRVVSDKQEPIGLRLAAVNWLQDKVYSHRRGQATEFPETIISDLAGVLDSVLKSQVEHSSLREQAVDALRYTLQEELYKIRQADPNVRRVLEEKRRHTKNVIRIDDLIRSGEVTFTEDTAKKLKSIEARILANTKLLATILADKENEPERLRRMVKHRLEMDRRLAIPGLQEEIDKALKHGDDLKPRLLGQVQPPASAPAGSQPAQ